MLIDWGEFYPLAIIYPMGKGVLRVYLGAAPGVGKTYKMLNEAWRRSQRGTDVAIGWVDTHGRSGTTAQIRDMEVIPPKIFMHREQEFREMDTDAIISRHPMVVLVDEFAHTNATGSKNEKRWQDVVELLENGIDVITTLNIQHLESLGDVVAAITGVIQHETVPDTVVREADQIEFVDMTPEALQRRLAHGDVYPKERIDMALANYFRLGNLVALRELALLWMADNVEEQLQSYRTRHGIDIPWETKERILVGLTGSAESEHLIRRAARMARRTKGDLLGVHIILEDDQNPQYQNSILDKTRSLLEHLGGVYKEVIGTEIADTLIEVAKIENVTQIVIGSSHRNKWRRLLNGSVVNDIIDKSGDMIDVHVISHSNVRKNTPERRGQGTDKKRAKLINGFVDNKTVSIRRKLMGLGFAAVALPILTAVLVSIRQQLTVGNVSLIFIIPIVITTAIGGAMPGLLSGFIAFFVVNWYFTPPIGTFSIASGRDITALSIFIIVTVIINILVDRAARKSNEAIRMRSHAMALSRTTTAILQENDPLDVIIKEIERNFLVNGLSLVENSTDGGAYKILMSSGVNPPTTAEEATFTLPLSDKQTLLLAGPELSVQDQEMLKTFTNQIKVTVINKELSDRAQESATLSKANEIRTALLAAVSHDLRTPLASIKASSSTYLSNKSLLGEEEKEILIHTIDEETNRLNTLVDNLLDMSRIYTNSIELHLTPVSIYEVVSAAIISLGIKNDKIDVYISESLPQVNTDPVLLERALANIMSNAIKASDNGQTIKIIAEVISKELIEVRIVDQGRGIPAQHRDRVFLPFQRLGDNRSTKGVGLGLAVAKGFLDALSSTIDIEDTPGGGTTMVIKLKYIQT